MSVSLPGLDLVVEGTVTRVADAQTLHRLAESDAGPGGPATVGGNSIIAPYSAPSAGPPPWDLYTVTSVTAFNVATAELYGATR